VERASIIIYDKIKKELSIEASFGIPISLAISYEIDIDNSIVGRVFKSGTPMLMNNYKNDERHHILSEKKDYKTNSFISIPIIYKNETIGVLSLTDKKNRERFDDFDLRVLTTASSQIAETYQNLQNQKIYEAQRRLKQEIEIASEIQKKILPSIPPRFKNHELAAYNRPAKEVGGDFYDFFQYDENKYGVLVADISGKGIPAAIFMGSARNIIRAEKNINTLPAKLLKNANRLIYQDSEYGMFVTLFYATIDSHNNIITYGSAGHDDQFLLRKKTGEAIKLNSRGKALGIIDNQEFEEKVVVYEHGDMLILFTDGVVECLGGNNLDVELGEKKLTEIAFSFIDSSPSLLINLLSNYLDHNSVDLDFRDDFTIFVVKF
jgi:phosphoserine phosphatase RsbU/P